MNTCQLSTHDELESSSPSECGCTSDLEKPKKGKQSKKQKNSSYKVKVKTEICKYWSIEGYCPYGKQCAFAHGKHEVRKKTHIPTNYKTKQCKNFLEEGFCPYGERCQFKHPAKKVAKLPAMPYTKLLWNIDILFQSKMYIQKTINFYFYRKFEKRSRGLPTLTE